MSAFSNWLASFLDKLSLCPRPRYKLPECHVCRPIFQQLGPSSHQLDTAFVEDSQKAACHGCTIADFALSLILVLAEGQIDRSSGLASVAFSLQYEDVVSAQASKLVVTAGLAESPHSVRQYEAELFKTYRQGGAERNWLRGLVTRPPPPAERALPRYIERAHERRAISGDTGSEEAFETATTWLEACLREHSECAGDLEPVLPTRVIDVGSGPEDGPVRLVETAGMKAPYVCLSHRWPPTPILRCLRANIDDLKKEIPVLDLTRNFQEVIAVVRRLQRWWAKTYPDRQGLRYLWIDSLCIIQDSKEDWDAESANMCANYENALLTVASATGSDACFAQVPLEFKGFDVSNPEIPNTAVYLRKELPHYSIDGSGELSADGIPGSMKKDGKRAPLQLFTRGWVLQERLLSRRLLVFTALELIWECQSRLACECQALREDYLDRGRATEMLGTDTRAHGPDINPYTNPNSEAIPTPIKIAHRRSLGDRGALRERNLKYWWKRLVSMYSRLHLTEGSDILPALSGLAAQYSRVAGETEYMAGLWRSSLPEDLLWIVEPAVWKGEVERVDVRCRDWRAPSWSWASVQVPVTSDQYFETRVHTYAKVLSANVVLAGVNPFGSISSGVITLEAPLFTSHDTAGGGIREDRGFKMYYYGDSGKQLGDFIGGQPFLLVTKHRTSETEGGGKEGMYWCFIHLHLVRQQKYTRLGVLILDKHWSSLQPHDAATDEMMWSFFEGCGSCVVELE